MKVQNRALGILAHTELWEQFSYYGMLTVLPLYLTTGAELDGLSWSSDAALRFVGALGALSLLAGLIGGLAADRLVGHERSVFVGGMAIAVGHAFVAASAYMRSGPLLDSLALAWSFLFGLCMIVVGTGMLKPNIVVLLGKLYPAPGALRESGFTYFYMGMSLGGLLSGLVAGTVGEFIGWPFAFAAAAAGMIIGMIVLALARVEVRLAVGPPGDIRTDAGNRTSLLDLKKLSPAMLDRLKGMAILGCTSIIFWAFMLQISGSLVLLAYEDIDRNVLGFEVPATWLVSLNSLFLIVLGPILALVWRRLEAAGRSPGTVSKFAFAFVLLLAAFGSISFGLWKASPAQGEQLSIAWLVVAVLLMTLAELSLWVTGLSIVEKLAPRGLEGQILGVWYLALAGGSYLSGEIGALTVHLGEIFVYFLISLASGAVAVMLLLTRGRLGQLLSDAPARVSPGT